MESSAALRTKNLVSSTTSTAISARPANVQDERSGLRKRSYRLGMANLGSLAWDLKRSMLWLDAIDNRWTWSSSPLAFQVIRTQTPPCVYPKRKLFKALFGRRRGKGGREG